MHHADAVCVQATRSALRAARPAEHDKMHTLDHTVFRPSAPETSRRTSVDHFGKGRRCCWAHTTVVTDSARADPFRADSTSALFDNLYFHSIQSPRAVSMEVRSVPPAHVVRREGDRLLMQPHSVPKFSALVEGTSEIHHTLACDWRYTLAESELPKMHFAAALADMNVAALVRDDARVDFARTPPGDYKLKGLKLRWFFREALRCFLPDETLTKKKQELGMPCGVWSLRDTPLMALASDSLASFSTRGAIRPQIRYDLVTQRLREHPR